MKIRIYYDQVTFRLKKAGDIKGFIEKVIKNESKVPGDLNFVFTGKEEMLKLNIEFLGHDYHTDVISFDYGENNIVSGEVYVGVETVKDNAVMIGVPFQQEVLNVMIHGLLHLCGYKDETEEERERMYCLQEKLILEFLKRT